MDRERAKSEPGGRKTFVISLEGFTLRYLPETDEIDTVLVVECLDPARAPSSARGEDGAGDRGM